LAIMKSNERKVSGDELRNALAIGLSKVLREVVDPTSIDTDGDSPSLCDMAINCTVTPRVKVPRKAKGKPAV